jgi:adenosine deaminase
VLRGTLPGMAARLLHPLDQLTPSPALGAMPKVDLHLHQEVGPRLDRVLAAREGRPAYDWRGWAGDLITSTPPGMSRLDLLSSVFPAPREAGFEDENFIARLEDLFEEAAAAGAVLVEVRCGNDTVLRPQFMALFREAERRTRTRYPALHASAVVTLLLWLEPARLETIVVACIAAARDGLAGVDLLYRPYDVEVDWTPAHKIAAGLADAGLGITAHAGEFSAANIEAALETPGLTRLGHAVHAACEPKLLDLIAARGATIECCLTCNVLLGAVPSYEEHPIRRFLEHGIPVALGTDNPVQLGTNIGREYAVASALGFTEADLLALTTNAIRAAFAPAALRAELVADVASYAAAATP